MYGTCTSLPRSACTIQSPKAGESPCDSHASTTLRAGLVCEFRLYDDEELDAETEANFALIVEAANAR